MYARVFIGCQHRDGTPDSKVHGANMGPNWGRQDPGGPQVGPMNLAIWDRLLKPFCMEDNNL